MASFKQLAQTDNRIKHSVNGWIRKAERELKLGYIPMMIRSICILYVGDCELFDESSCFGVINVDENKREIYRIHYETSRKYSYCYGSIKINSTKDVVCQWDLQILKCEYYGKGVTIGVEGCGGHEYIYENDGEIYDQSSGWIKGSQKAGINDKISVYLDLKQRKVFFYVNGKRQVNCCGNIAIGEGITYRLRVGIKSHTRVKMLNF